MKIENIATGDLADMAERIAELLENGQLSAIDPVVRAGLIAALGEKPAELAEQTAEAELQEARKKAAFSTRDATQGDVVDWTRQVRDQLKAVRAPKEQFDLCGFEYSTGRVGAYNAQNPTDMSAEGFSNGVNNLRFTGNNRHGMVTYEIWRRDGRDGAWRKHALTRKQSFKDTNVTPGQYYEYRVRAVAAQKTSGFSNSTIVYGVL